MQLSTFKLYGVLETKIVGVQYYKGIANIGEYVILRKEPSNQYDRNAIRVEIVQRDQIGHTPRNVAAKLAKYIDDGRLRLEGSLTGRIGSYDCPMSVKDLSSSLSFSFFSFFLYTPSSFLLPCSFPYPYPMLSTHQVHSIFRSNAYYIGTRLGERKEGESISPIVPCPEIECEW